MPTKKKKTTIRLSEEDEQLIARLGKVLGYKLGQVADMSQSEVIRYSLRRLAAQELPSSELVGKMGENNG